MSDSFPAYDAGGGAVLERIGFFSRTALDPTPTPSTMYRMRARHLPSGSYVQWDSSTLPDTDGSQSGYPPSDLSDIVIIRKETTYA